MSDQSEQAPAYLVTGAAGFIGARLVEALNRRGNRVISVDDIGNFQSRAEHQSVLFGQKIDKEDLFHFLDAQHPALVGIFHIGACSDTTETSWDLLFRNNVEYSRRLWDYASAEGIPFYYASSAATYGDGSFGYDDDENLIDRLEPLNLYGKSKLDFDRWVLQQERSGKAPPSWAGFRFFNVFGWGERHKGRMASVVLHAFDQITGSGRVRLFRSHRDGIPDGHQKRDFIFIDDVINVLLFGADRKISRGIYNLGTGQARTFLDLAGAVFRALDTRENIEFIDTPLGIRDQYQYFTEARMQRLRRLGYSASFTSLERGIEIYVKKLVETGFDTKAP